MIPSGLKLNAYRELYHKINLLTDCKSDSQHYHQENEAQSADIFVVLM
jgi:hypothetical protein